MKYSTIIIEDENLAARKLERMLKTFPEIDLVASLDSVENSINWLENNPHPDLIFSDISLGDGLSFEIFERVPIKSFIIYTTAYDQYSLRAFKLNSIDYLLKPINEEELKSAFEKFKTFLPSQNTASTKNIFNQDQYIKRIVVKIGYNLKIVFIDEISCFYSENKIVYAQTKERTFPTDFTLDELEKNLDPQKFFRTNRQSIINCDYIKNIHTSPYYKVELLFQPEQEISISRDRVKDFKNWLGS